MKKQFVVKFRAGSAQQGKRELAIYVEAFNPVQAVPEARRWVAEVYGKVMARSATPLEVALA